MPFSALFDNQQDFQLPFQVPGATPNLDYESAGLGEKMAFPNFLQYTLPNQINKMRDSLFNTGYQPNIDTEQPSFGNALAQVPSVAINNLKQKFSSPGKALQDLYPYTLFSARESAVPAMQTIGEAVGAPETFTNLGYGLRGALGLTPFQSFGTSPTEAAQAPSTEAQQTAQKLGQGAYGLALTAPLGTGSLIGKIAGRAGISSGIGALMGGALGPKTQTTAERVKKGAIEGFSRSWQIALGQELANNIASLPIVQKVLPTASKPFGALGDLSLKSAGPYDKAVALAKGFRMLFDRALVETPIEDVIWSTADYLNDDKKQNLAKNIISNLDDFLIGNLIYAGIAGTTGGAAAWNKKQLGQLKNAVVSSLKQTLTGTDFDLAKQAKAYMTDAEDQATQAWKDPNTSWDDMQQRFDPRTLAKIQFREKGLGKLADFENAVNAGDMNLAKKIGNDIVNKEGESYYQYRQNIIDLMKEFNIGDQIDYSRTVPTSTPVIPPSSQIQGPPLATGMESAPGLRQNMVAGSQSRYGGLQQKAEAIKALQGGRPLQNRIINDLNANNPNSPLYDPLQDQLAGQRGFMELGPSQADMNFVQTGPSRFTRTGLPETGQPGIQQESLFPVPNNEPPVKVTDMGQTVYNGPLSEYEPAGQRQGYQFYSPNIEENLSFDESMARLGSQRHQVQKQLGQQIDDQIGVKSNTMSAIGDWADGAEDSFVDEISNAEDFDQVRYLAAIKARLADQKAAIPFMVDPNGTSRLYMADFGPETPVDEIRQSLSDNGIQFRTIVPLGKGQGTRVMIFDPDNSLSSNVEDFAVKYQKPVKSLKGIGEFIGEKYGDTRAAARRQYTEIERAYADQFPDRRLYSGESGQGIYSGGSSTPQSGTGPTPTSNPSLNSQAGFARIPDAESLIKKTKSLFGLTTDPENAAFILPSGGMVKEYHPDSNLSTEFGPVESSHPEMADKVIGNNAGQPNLQILLDKTGMIRMRRAGKSLFVEMQHEPTEEQFVSIRKAAKGDPIVADLSTPDGGIAGNKAFDSFGDFKSNIAKLLQSPLF